MFLATQTDINLSKYSVLPLVYWSELFKTERGAKFAHTKGISFNAANECAKHFSVYFYKNPEKARRARKSLVYLHCYSSLIARNSTLTADRRHPLVPLFHTACVNCRWPDSCYIGTP